MHAVAGNLCLMPANLNTLIHPCNVLKKERFKACGSSTKFFKFILSLNSPETLIQRKQHQTQKFFLKAPDPCWNIHILNMAYCIMLLLNSSVVVPLGLLSHCVLRYLLSRQVLLFFQKEKEEKAASCKTQIMPRPPCLSIWITSKIYVVLYNDKDGKTFCRKLGQFYNETRWNLMFQADLG